MTLFLIPLAFLAVALAWHAGETIGNRLADRASARDAERRAELRRYMRAAEDDMQWLFDFNARHRS